MEFSDERQKLIYDETLGLLIFTSSKWARQVKYQSWQRNQYYHYFYLTSRRDAQSLKTPPSSDTLALGRQESKRYQISKKTFYHLLLLFCSIQILFGVECLRRNECRERESENDGSNFSLPTFFSIWIDQYMCIIYSLCMDFCASVSLVTNAFSTHPQFCRSAEDQFLICTKPSRSKTLLEFAVIPVDVAYVLDLYSGVSLTFSPDLILPCHSWWIFVLHLLQVLVYWS